MSAGEETAPAAPAKAVTLYDLVKARELVNEWAQHEAAENDGALPEWLEELQLEAEDGIDAKVERIRRFCVAQDAEASVIDAEITRLQARKSVRQQRVARLKRYVLTLLGSNGLKKISTPLGDVGRQPNGGVRGWAKLADGAVLKKYGVPYVTELTVFTVDEAALRSHLEAAGADELVVKDEDTDTDVIIAQLAPRGEHVRFR